jgi:AraC family transcriptional activator of mtrCDE
VKSDQKVRHTEDRPDLDNLINSLNAKFAGLAECFVSSGHRLEIGASPNVGIHYNVLGSGRMTVGGSTTIDLVPHTLVVVSPNHSFRIEVHSEPRNAGILRAVDGHRRVTSRDGIRRFVTGTTDPTLVMMCGFFSASFGQSTELFMSLSAPIVERFGAGDQLDVRLKQALNELVAQQAGSGAMSAALLKQVLVMLMRRSLARPGAWTERFTMLSDMQIARAFSEMVANPGANHTVRSLAQVACLSRSTFMARFTAVMGRPPMAVLRDLRMRRAVQVLETKSLSVGQVASEVGYSGHSSFVRAFRDTYGVDPSEYRAQQRMGASAHPRAVRPGSVSPSPK